MSGWWRLGLVWAVTALFAVWMVHWMDTGPDPRSVTATPSVTEEVTDVPTRFTGQLMLMWTIATDEQRDYLCRQYFTTDGTAAWNQALIDNSLAFDGYRPENRDQWDLFLAARCG